MNNHEILLVHVAQLYYHQNLNQSEISKIVGLSRPTVSRMLEEAREVGIVEIIVHDPIRKNHDLSARLRDQLGLREALIISGKYQHDVALEKCANEAAQFVSSILDNNMSIGFSWGRAIRAVCNAFQSSEYYNVTVVQMAGCLSVGDPTYDGLELATTVAQKFNASYTNIVSPVYVDHMLVQQALLAAPQIKKALAATRNLDIVLTGVGTLDDTNGSSYLFTGSENDLKLAKEYGAVGHVLARLMDKDGNEVTFPNHYPIAAPLEALREADWSIGIVASKKKALATLAAIKGGYINCLIADESLALELLKLTK